MRNESQDTTVVCAWCNRVLSNGGSRVSHGICNPCAQDLLTKLQPSTKLAAAGYTN